MNFQKQTVQTLYNTSKFYLLRTCTDFRINSSHNISESFSFVIKFDPLFKLELKTSKETESFRQFDKPSTTSELLNNSKVIIFMYILSESIHYLMKIYIYIYLCIFNTIIAQTLTLGEFVKKCYRYKIYFHREYTNIVTYIH